MHTQTGDSGLMIAIFLGETGNKINQFLTTLSS